MAGAEQEARRRAERAEQVALFRYRLIREAADPGLTTRQRGRVVRELAAAEHPGPFGQAVRVSLLRILRLGLGPFTGSTSVESLLLFLWKVAFVDPSILF